jgi:hypothetical protein
VQAYATAARNCGSLAAYLITAGLYTCHRQGGDGPADRTVIGLTAIVPFVTAVLAAFWLVEPKASDTAVAAEKSRSRAKARGGRRSGEGDATVQAGTGTDTGTVASNNRTAASSHVSTDSSHVSTGTRINVDANSDASFPGGEGGDGGGGRSWQGAVGLVSLQLLFLWVGLRDFVSFSMWWKVLAGCVTLYLG